MAQPTLPKKLRDLVRGIVQLPIGPHLAGFRNDNRGFIRGFLGMDKGMHALIYPLATRAILRTLRLR